LLESGTIIVGEPGQLESDVPPSGDKALSRSLLLDGGEAVGRLSACCHKRAPFPGWTICEDCRQENVPERCDMPHPRQGRSTAMSERIFCKYLVKGNAPDSPDCDCELGIGDDCDDCPLEQANRQLAAVTAARDHLLARVASDKEALDRKDAMLDSMTEENARMRKGLEEVREKFDPALGTTPDLSDLVDIEESVDRALAPAEAGKG